MEDVVRNALQAAGWTPGREADPGDDLSALSEAGYSPWPELIAFLREFTGLRLSFIRGGVEDSAWFSASRACASLPSAWVRDWEARAGSRLVPVGNAYRDHLTLLAAADGRFFGTYDEFMTFLGNSPYTMIDSLIHQKMEQIG